MRGAVVFYSFSGNTRRAVEYLKESLALKNIEAEAIELEPNLEERRFIKQCLDAFSKKKPGLRGSLDYNLSGFDYMVFASPVWAFRIAPALRSYLDKLVSLKNKKALCFLTYGSGAGAQKALGELENILKDKGASPIDSLLLAGYKTKNRDYLEEKLKSFLNFNF